jgi:anti-anti-sigma factor
MEVDTVADSEYVVRPEGELDIVTVPAVRAEWLEAIDSQRPRHFGIDLSRVTFLDSTALSAIVAAYKRQTKHSCDVKIVNARSKIARVIEIVGLNTVIPVIVHEADTDS